MLDITAMYTLSPGDRLVIYQLAPDSIAQHGTFLTIDLVSVTIRPDIGNRERVPLYWFSKDLRACLVELD